MNQYEIYYSRDYDRLALPYSHPIIVEAKDEIDARRVFKKRMNGWMRKWKIHKVVEKCE